MWSITSYYNPARYKRRLSNYRIFRKNLATPLVTVELSFDGGFELRQGDADILERIPIILKHSQHGGKNLSTHRG
jgi:hypothetical protein